MYSRENPSPRYIELVEQYKQLHAEGEKVLGVPADNTFPGFSVLPHVDHIKKLIQRKDANFLLDYGCGKGKQYALPIVDSGAGEKELLVDYWDVAGVQCYDPCFPPYSSLPEGTFDGVICTDMLEHCSEEDVDWILDEMFSYADDFLYTNVACYPAKKTLPNGENAHCTIKSPDWWQEALSKAGDNHPDVEWEARLTYLKDSKEDGQSVLQEVVLTGNA